MNKEIELAMLPCPFCRAVEQKILSNGIGDYYVLCEYCLCRTSDEACEDKRFAVERWNRRADANSRSLSTQLQHLGDEIHANKIAHGWVPTVPDDFHDPGKLLGVLMLIVTEVAEAAEAVRNSDIGNFEEELADVVIRTVGLAHGMKFDLGQAVEAKMEKNRNRPYKHGGKRI